MTTATKGRSTAAKISSREEEAIRKQIDEFVAAWNRHNPQAMSMVFAEDADLINPFGRIAKSRIEIEKLFKEEHAGTLKNSHRELKFKGLRFLTQDHPRPPESGIQKTWRYVVSRGLSADDPGAQSGSEVSHSLALDLWRLGLGPGATIAWQNEVMSGLWGVQIRPVPLSVLGHSNNTGSAALGWRRSRRSQSDAVKLHCRKGSICKFVMRSLNPKFILMNRSSRCCLRRVTPYGLFRPRPLFMRR